MNKRIIKVLKFPREKIKHELEIGECVHSGYFDPADRKCEFCDSSSECLWLYQNEEESVLELKSLEELCKALEFSMAYIDSQVSEQGHNYKNCRCEHCAWLRNANKVFRQLVRVSH